MPSKKQEILCTKTNRQPRPIVKKILQYKKRGSVLDLGTGIRGNSVFLAKKGFKVLALDNDKEKLTKLKKLAKQKGVKLTIKQADITHFKPKKKYDVIIATMVLHFLKKKEVKKVIAMMKLHTISKGLNIITVYTNKNKANLRPYLFKKNELKNFYKNWDKLIYREELGIPYRTVPGGNIYRHHGARIIAQKP